jgi:hypothetical protein
MGGESWGFTLPAEALRQIRGAVGKSVPYGVNIATCLAGRKSGHRSWKWQEVKERSNHFQNSMLGDLNENEVLLGLGRLTLARTGSQARQFSNTV